MKSNIRLFVFASFYIFSHTEKKLLTAESVKRSVLFLLVLSNIDNTA